MKARHTIDNSFTLGVHWFSQITAFTKNKWFPATYVPHFLLKHKGRLLVTFSENSHTFLNKRLSMVRIFLKRISSVLVSLTHRVLLVLVSILDVVGLIGKETELAYAV